MKSEKLFEMSLAKYSASDDFPALAQQYGQWKRSKPLCGLRLLDATPVFANTLPKYAALLAAGTELCVCRGEEIPADASIYEVLSDCGVEIFDVGSIKSDFDCVLDCAAVNRFLTPKLGFCELTRTGAIKYADCRFPVFVADDSVVKEFETKLGTGDGFARAIESISAGDFFKGGIAVFGSGKVGCGIIAACARRGARVIAVDFASMESAARKAGASEFAALEYPDAVAKAAASSDCIVSATGLKGAVKLPPEVVSNSDIILANMGVDDEFGESVPAARVLNSKRPLNFILDEPTRLKYIDPTLALHNYGVVELLSGRLHNGTNKPSRELEKIVLSALSPQLLAEAEGIIDLRM